MGLFPLSAVTLKVVLTRVLSVASEGCGATTRFPGCGCSTGRLRWLQPLLPSFFRWNRRLLFQPSSERHATVSPRSAFRGGQRQATQTEKREQARLAAPER